MAAKKKSTEEKAEKAEKETKKKKKKDSEESVKEQESVQAADDKTDKLAKLKEKLKEKAAKLEAAVTEKEEDLKKSLKVSEKDKKDTLVPIEDYLKSSIHLGTRAITPDMRPFVYKRRADSLAVFNTALLDEKIREAAEYLSQFAPDQVVVVCKREAGHHAVELFGKTTGIRTFTKKYPAGILTNPQLENFLETDLVLICDPWTDKNAFNDASRVKIPVLAICDTNNYTAGVTKILPGNNKSSKSLGMIFYLLTKLYAEKRNLQVNLPTIQEFVANWDNLVPPK